MSGERRLPSAEVERIVPAPPAEVFDAWLDEAVLREFVCPAPGRAVEVSVDPQLGGQYRYLMSLPDRELVVTGEYIALDRPERISFTWRCSDTGDLESVVTVTLEPRGNDATLMLITHSLLPGKLIDQHLEGWTLVARQLAARLRSLPDGRTPAALQALRQPVRKRGEAS